MRFQPGQSGNPKGRPRKLLPSPDEVMAERGISPVEEILKLIPDLSLNMQAKVWLELMSYVHAKPKEIAVDPSLAEQMSTEELLAKIKEKAPELNAA